jgi:hypothetical protein
MKRFRLSTLMLLVVIAALGIALVVQYRRYARREAELQVRLTQAWPVFLKQQKETAEIRRLQEELLAKMKEAVEINARFNRQSEKNLRRMQTLIPDLLGGGEAEDE